MSGIQEVLAALEGQKSPFINLLEGVASGYSNAQQNRVQNAKALLELDAMRQEQELKRQEQQRRIAEDLRIRTERGIMSNFKSQGGISAVTPQQKQKSVIESDSKTGLLSEKITYETDDTPLKVETVSYRDRKTGENRIGKKLPTGEVVQSPNDPLSPNQPKAEPLSLAEQLDIREKSKLKALQPKEKKHLTSATSGYDSIIAEATAIRDNPSLKYAVGIASPLGRIYSTSARATRARINTLVSKTALNTLQDIRQSSPTGGALGNISDKDTALLKDQIASLDTGMSVDDFRDALNRIIDYADKSKKRLQTSYDETYGVITGGATVPPPADGSGKATPKKIGRFTVEVAP